jgi:TrkA-N domain.
MNVVVLGAGFAGYNLIKGLVKDESINKITVIDKSQSRLKKPKS